MRWTGARLGVATALAALGLFAAALVHFFAQPVTPFEPPPIPTPVVEPPTASPPAVPDAPATATSAPTDAPGGGSTAPAPLSSPGRDTPPRDVGVAAEEPTPESPPAPAAPTSPPPRPSAPEDAAPEPGETPRETPAVLARGDRGSAVLDLQRRLRTVGIHTTPVDGVYGQPTEAAVQNYQALRGVQADPKGVYGPHTRAALESET
ncbi:peptidoglycan-binding domain-containing protein [Streptomyces sp. GSL17-111]|uniref:peptidoglycan-binding domain-containing protein n=1 Tax=Streptomyces sp. GSL17-111 TaxID=3121596 RepID=UPI0030F4A0ED